MRLGVLRGIVSAGPMTEGQHGAVDGGDSVQLRIYSFCVESGVAIEVAHQGLESACLTF